MIRRLVTRFITWEAAQLIFVAGVIVGMVAEAAFMVFAMAGHSLVELAL